MLGFCLLWRGKLEEAEDYFERGREAARSRGWALIETRCLVYGSIARRRRNDVEGARSWLLELEAQEELHGYRGLVAANGAWVALRDGDLELATARGEEAFADWHDGVHGSPFEWTARFPLLAVELARGRLDGAVEHARAMLDESQQPLPEELAEALLAGASRKARSSRSSGRSSSRVRSATRSRRSSGAVNTVRGIGQAPPGDARRGGFDESADHSPRAAMRRSPG